MNGENKSSSIRFRLAIPAEQYLPYYRGEVKDVQVHALNNQKVRFPASASQILLTHDGIHGLFEIRFDESRRLIGVERVKSG